MSHRIVAMPFAFQWWKVTVCLCHVFVGKGNNSMVRLRLPNTTGLPLSVHVIVLIATLIVKGAINLGVRLLGACAYGVVTPITVKTGRVCAAYDVTLGD